VSVSKWDEREETPATPSTSVAINATISIAGFYAGLNDFWGGNAAIGNADTTIVLGNLDGTPKIALGATADILSISNMATYPGFYADGFRGMLRGGNAGGGFVGFRWSVYHLRRSCRWLYPYSRRGHNSK